MKFFHKVKVTTSPYCCSSTSKCFVIYETAVICRRLGRFLVFCARRTNEGGCAEEGLVDTSSTQWASELS